MIEDSIDYEGLFKQLRRENEGLRLYILKLKTLSPTIFDGVKEKITDFITEEGNKQILTTLGLIVFAYLIIPAIRVLFTSVYRRFTHEK